MRETGGINNRGVVARTDDREWNANVHFFFVGAGFNLDEIVGRGMIDGGLDAREAVMGTGRIDTKGPGSGQLHRDRHRGKQSHCRNQGKSSKFHVASLSVGSWNRTGPVQSNRWDGQKQGVRLSGTSICPKRLLSRVVAGLQ